MSKLLALGFWHGPHCPELPIPQQLVGAPPEADERGAVVAYLRSGRVRQAYKGSSYCRFHCEAEHLGNRDLTDGVWLWPEGLAHYVEVHGVKLPEEFLVRVRAPGDAPRDAVSSSDDLDMAPWTTWASSRGGMVLPEGYVASLESLREIPERLVLPTMRALTVVDQIRVGDAVSESRHAFEMRDGGHEVRFEALHLVPGRDLMVIGRTDASYELELFADQRPVFVVFRRPSTPEVVVHNWVTWVHRELVTTSRLALREVALNGATAAPLHYWFCQPG